MLTLLSCFENNSGKKQQDNFYLTGAGWDWLRLPLIKPYYAMCPSLNRDSDEKKPWDVELYSDLLYSAHNIKYLNIQDSIIYILCGSVNDNLDSTIVKGNIVAKAWFIVDVKRKEENHFLQEQEFYAYVKKRKYPKPVWQNIDSIHNKFGETGKLPWRSK